MDGFSSEISRFLDFLRSCEETNRTAAITEIDMDNKTQDILHHMELAENSQYDYICQGFTLKDIRQKRRRAKDQKDITQPICAWYHENKKTIQELEKLLGTVRKAEKRTENRYYNNRTNIMEGILKEEGP